MPEEGYTYRPTEVSKPCRTNGTYCIRLNCLLSAMCRYGDNSNQPDASTMNKEAILELLRKGFDYTTELFTPWNKSIR